MMSRKTDYIPSEDRDFFILLRAGLWQRVDEELSRAPSWEHIYRLSCDQTVQGIVADGLTIYKSIHPDLEIPDVWNNRFFADSLRIIKSNHAINAVQARICDLFNQKGITYVVMKGQTVAQCYPKPELRCPGDIDYYLDYENYERAKHCLEKIADRELNEKSNEKHIEYYVDGIGVELHADEAYDIGGQRRFNDLLTEMLNSNQLRGYKIGETEIKTAPCTFDVMYSFLHSDKHYLRDDIGLRQFCDLAMLIHRNYGELDFGYLCTNLRKFGAVRVWNQFIGFLTIFLGLPENESHFQKFKPDIKRSHHIWKVCRIYGNFGRGSMRKDLEQVKEYDNYIIRNIVGFHNNQKMIMKSFSYNPRFAIKKVLEMYGWYLGMAYRKIFHIGGDKFNV